MKINVLFFAQLRDYAGVDSLILDVEESRLPVRGLLKVLKDKLPAELLDALKDESTLVSVNQKYAGWDSELSDGDELGFLPPVSGG